MTGVEGERRGEADVTAASSSPVSDWIQRLPLLLIKCKADKTWQSILCGNQLHFTRGVNVYTGFPRLLESPGFFFLKIPGPGKSWKITLVLESPGN